MSPTPYKKLEEGSIEKISLETYEEHGILFLTDENNPKDSTWEEKLFGKIIKLIKD